MNYDYLFVVHPVTFSFDIVSPALYTRSSSMESLNSQRNSRKNPLRQSNNGQTGSDIPRSNNADSSQASQRLSRLKGAGAKTAASSAEKENLAAASSAADSSLNAADVTDVTNASLPVDPDNEMAEIDARLNALQNFMKSMGHD